MTIADKLKALEEIFAAANAKAAPLIAELEPYLAVHEAAKKAGVGKAASAMEIAQGFAGQVDLTPPKPDATPSNLDPNAPQQIDDAAATLIERYKSIGAAIGKLAGAAVGML